MALPLERTELILQDGDLFLKRTVQQPSQKASETTIDSTSATKTSLEPFRLLAGAMHYFRIPPEYWEDRIVKCRQMGCNAIETYIAWNVHEPEPGQWTFEGFADIVRFIRLVQKHGLYMIVRVSPYICAEWDNGGIPYWLLRDRNVRMRSRHPTFSAAAKTFYRVIIEDKLKPFFASNGGPILAGQLENEYGCTNNDREYLQEHYRFLREDLGVDIPLFNGIWAEERFVKAGQCEGTIVALNFNDGAAEKFSWLEKQQQPSTCSTSSTTAPNNSPRVCTEFWVGWFSAWGGHRYKPREPPQVIADRLDELLNAKGHAILYLFHGGTNFGMRNGSNIRAEYSQFTITSYDYEAPLNEAGQITPYYKALQAVTTKHGFIPASNDDRTPEKDPESILPVSPPTSYPSVQVKSQALLLDQLGTPSFQASKILSPYPLSMEECHQAYGYLLYRTRITGPTPPPGDDENAGGETLTINELRDRAHVFLDGSYLETLERTAGRCVAQTKKRFRVPAQGYQLDILVENQGRCNFPPFTQDFKGITENVFVGDCFVLSNWEHYPLSFFPDQLEHLEWTQLVSENREMVQQQKKNRPSFFCVEWDLSSYPKQQPLRDTYIHLPQWQKGVVLVNGFNLGRYWNKGPQLSLYCPATILLRGTNEIVLFEEESAGDTIEFIDNLIMRS